MYLKSPETHLIRELGKIAKLAQAKGSCASRRLGPGGFGPTTKTQQARAPQMQRSLLGSGFTEDGPAQEVGASAAGARNDALASAACRKRRPDVDHQNTQSVTE